MFYAITLRRWSVSYTALGSSPHSQTPCPSAYSLQMQKSGLHYWGAGDWALCCLLGDPGGYNPSQGLRLIFRKVHVARENAELKF